jgi:hypothetical protein
VVQGGGATAGRPSPPRPVGGESGWGDAVGFAPGADPPVGGAPPDGCGLADDWEPAEGGEPLDGWEPPDG